MNQFANHTVANSAGTNVSFKSGDNWTLFTGAISAQEVLEEAWLQAFYEHAVWGLLKAQLADAKTGGATAKAFPVNPDITTAGTSRLLSAEKTAASTALATW